MGCSKALIDKFTNPQNDDQIFHDRSDGPFAQLHCSKNDKKVKTCKATADATTAAGKLAFIANLADAKKPFTHGATINDQTCKDLYNHNGWAGTAIPADSK